LKKNNHLYKIMKINSKDLMQLKKKLIKLEVQL